MRYLTILLLALTFGFSPQLARADEKHYVILFAAEREGNPPRYSHTWATFLKVEDSAEGGQPSMTEHSMTEHFTISWFPASGVIPALVTVRGRNYTLQESLDWAWRNG